MIGAVGDDAFGGALTDSLRSRSVDTKTVSIKAGSSGLAFITVSESGENTIVLSAGSNGKLSEADVTRDALAGTEIALLQNEIPLAVNLHALKLCAELGIKVCYNPAPAAKLPAEALPLIDTLVVNETEAEVVSGLAVNGLEDAERAARALQAEGVGRVIVTLGGKGALALDRGGDALRVPAFKVEPADTTAAGDTFIGAYAAATAAGLELAPALRYAASRGGDLRHAARRAELDPCKGGDRAVSARAGVTPRRAAHWLRPGEAWRNCTKRRSSGAVLPCL
ncbi:PfkB family carbohydrate kinase [Cohnella rhizosphaerae]|uniref:PfkB family carbohydrate kinase n=1 Tax=Cohnella rhizosphaerae TaxID=1457232 RepID=UPI0030B8E6DF